MGRKAAPIVDDADVNYWVDYVRKHADFTKSTPEERARGMYQVVLDASKKLSGHSPEYAKALAEKVRKRMLWAQPMSAADDED